MTDSPLNKLARQMLRDLGAEPVNSLPAMALAMQALQEPEEAGLEFPDLDLWMVDELLLEASRLARGKSPEAVKALAGAEVEDGSLQAAEQMLLLEIRGKPPMEAAGILAARLYRNLRPTLEPRQD
jgi:hypothetical protein